MREEHKIYLEKYENLLKAKGYNDKNCNRRTNQLKNYLNYLAEENIKTVETTAEDAKRYFKERYFYKSPATIEDVRYILDKFYTLLKTECLVKENIFTRENIYGIKDELKEDDNIFYLKSYQSHLKDKKYKDETVRKTIKIIKSFLHFLEEKNINLKEAEVKDAKEYLNEINKNSRKATREDKRYLLHRFYEFLKTENIVTENIFKKNKSNYKPQIKLTEEQEKLLKEFTDYEKNYGKRRISANKNSREVFHTLNYFNENDIDYLHIKVSEAENLQEYLTGLKDDKGNIFYTSGTISEKVTAVSIFYDFLVKREITAYNPFKEIKRIKREKSLPKNVLNEEKMNRFLEKIKEKIKTGKDLNEKKIFYRIHVIAELMYSTGARINEIIKLKEEDFDFATGTVKLLDSKTGKERRAFLNSYIVEILRIYFKFKENIIIKRSQKEYLFLGDASVKRCFNNHLDKLSKSLGYGKFTSHNIRHSFGYQMLKAGCDIRYIQAFLGHESLGATQVYTKIEKSDLKSVLDKFHPRKFVYTEKRKAS